MNKYQQVILANLKISVNISDATVKLDNGTIILKQSENAYIEKYDITFENTAIDSVIVGGKTYTNENNKILFELDFANQSKEIIVNFIDNIADSLFLSLTYEATSKEAWDEKNKKELWGKRQENAKITVSTGIDLVNIYFQPCSDDYGKTVIELYTANGKWQPHPHVMGRGQVFKPRLLGAEVALLMGKFTVEDGMFFKSIGGLAKGAYGYRLSQYNTKGELLFSTDYAYFAIYN